RDAHDNTDSPPLYASEAIKERSMYADIHRDSYDVSVVPKVGAIFDPNRCTAVGHPGFLPGWHSLCAGEINGVMVCDEARQIGTICRCIDCVTGRIGYVVIDTMMPSRRMVDCLVIDTGAHFAQCADDGVEYNP